MLLVRHGQTPTTGQGPAGPGPGLHLADAGRSRPSGGRAHRRAGRQAKVDAVYASPLERTRETAAPIAKARGLRVRSDAGLLECDFGEWTGAELKELRKLPEWRTVQRYPSGFRFPGGESFAEMQVRISGAVDRLVRRHPGGTVVAVSHADPIKAAVAHALGTHLDLFQRIVSPRARSPPSLYAADGPVVLAVNSTGETSPPWRRRERRSSCPIPDVFTAGAVGEPGQRVFFLQAATASRSSALRCEKHRSPRWPSTSPSSSPTSPDAVGVAAGDLDLVEPVVASWVVGSLGVAYDEAVDRIVLVPRSWWTRTTSEDDRRRLGAGAAHPGAGGGLRRATPGRWSPPAGRRAGSAGAARPRRPRLPADQLTPMDGRRRSTRAAPRRGRDKGRMPWSSNATFLVEVRLRRRRRRARLQARRGERPLWDFPAGLYRREVAAYELAAALGLGPRPAHGPARRARSARARCSSSSTPTSSSTTSRSTRTRRHHDRCDGICAFDLVANNTDRKSGHCLLGLDGHIWAIDNGLCSTPSSSCAR